MKYLAALIFWTMPLFSITCDLLDPQYCDGVLKTEKGGVIETDQIRIQAQTIIYSQNQVIAEGQLMVEYGPYLFVGKRIEYNFELNCGVIFEGKTGVDPWYFGGDEILLNADGSYSFKNAFATTSENAKFEWHIKTKMAILREGKFLTAKNITLSLWKTPVFWFPGISANVNSILDAPLRFTFRWGGSHGARIGAIYEFYKSERWETFLRLDYRFKRGFGGGFETYYKGINTDEKFESINYIAQDATRSNHDRTRYRFQGLYGNAYGNGKTTLWISYDKLSDKDMATDYYDNGLTLKTAEPTEFIVRRQENDAIFNGITRVRINSFQTVKQELPTLMGSLRPQAIGNTGMIIDGRFEASYLEFDYQDGKECSSCQDEERAKDYNSTRVEFSGRIFRPYHFGWITSTPEAGWVSIWYGNNSEHRDRFVNVGCFNWLTEAPFYRFYSNKKHVITPYIQLQNCTLPSTDPKHHYIFDITDGWYKLNRIRFGLTQNLYTKNCSDCISRILFLDLWGNAFYSTETIPQAVQKTYVNLIYNPIPTLRHTFQTAYDFQHNMLDHFNWQVLWTASDNIALTAEYRHRSSFDFRKVDKDNFIMDSYLSSSELYDSELSDRRDTLLLQFFARFHPNWALQIESRNGWRRRCQPAYFEYEVDLLGTIRSSWKVKVSYRHREEEDRFFVNFSLGIDKPDPCARKVCPMCIDF